MKSLSTTTKVCQDLTHLLTYKEYETGFRMEISLVERATAKETAHNCERLRRHYGTWLSAGILADVERQELLLQLEQDPKPRERLSWVRVNGETRIRIVPRSADDAVSQRMEPNGNERDHSRSFSKSLN